MRRVDVGLDGRPKSPRLQRVEQILDAVRKAGGKLETGGVRGLAALIGGKRLTSR